MNKREIRVIKILMLSMLLIFVIFMVSGCEPFIPNVSIGMEQADSPDEVSSSIQILLALTVLALAPSILIMMTSFTRIIIVLSFLRNALGTQQMPPNQILIGLALFLTLFIMTPIGTRINEEALKPYNNEQINQQDALEKSTEIIKGYMLKQFNDDRDLAFFTKLSGMEPSEIRPEDLPLRIVIPAFIINELTVAFKIGFFIFIPFLVIDMVVSSTLMSMGMMMLPPIMISLPFKILLFVMVRGWSLVVEVLIKSFAV